MPESGPLTGGDRWLLTALAVVVLATAVAVPAFVGARPAYEIPVEEGAVEGNLGTPDAAAWDRVPAATVPLTSAGAAVPSADDTTVQRATVQAVRDEGRLYLRITWADPTRDVSADGIRSFRDAVAVQFPANASRRPPIAMGSTDNRVNVWYWTGPNVTQELLAGGPGSTTPFPNRTLEASATHADGRWQVVFQRELSAASPNRTRIPTDADLDLAVGVWNGSNMERSGRKATSEWYYLALGPGPQGPPYEAILWTIAGIGIVVTTLVTIQGIRETGGEGS